LRLVFIEFFPPSLMLAQVQEVSIAWGS
jgi:hypothetical protein